MTHASSAIIRPLQAAGAPVWRKLWTDYLTFHKSGIPEAVCDAADRQGAPSVYWMTQDDNATGRQLYDRFGKLTNFIKCQRPA